MKQKLPIIIFLFLLTISTYAVNDAKKNTYYNTSNKNQQNTEYNYHTTQGETSLHENDYIKAIEEFQFAEKIASKSHNKKGIISSNMNMGIVYMEISSFEKALDHFLIAYELSKSNHTALKAEIELNLGILLEQTGELESALSFLLKSADYYEKNTLNNHKLVQAYSNIGIAYGRNAKSDSALLYFNKGLELANKNGFTKDSGAILNNIGAIYFKKSDFDSARYFYKKSLSLFNDIELKKGIAIAKMNLGQIDMAAGNFPKALEYLESSTTTFQQLGTLFHLRESYYNLSDLYNEMGNYKKALDYHMLYSEINDSINNQETLSKTKTIETQNLIEIKEKELKITQRDNKLKSLQKKLLSFTIIAIILIGIFIFFYQKTKIKNSKLSNTVLEKEQELLKQDLNFKKTELENYALHIVQKNEFLTEIKSSLKSIKQNANDNNKDKINELNLKLNQYLRINKEEQNLAKHINNVNDSFFSHLRNKFPQLTKKDQHLCALLKLNLTSKEIAILNNVTERAIIMARYRLRKKLGIPKDMAVLEFLEASEKKENPD